MKNRAQEKKVQHSSAITKKHEFDVYLKSFMCMVELDHRRSGAKTLGNKLGLNTYLCYLTYIVIAGLCHILRF